MRKYLLLLILLLAACQATPLEQTAIDVTRTVNVVITPSPAIETTRPIIEPSPTVELSPTIMSTARATAVPTTNTLLPMPIYYIQANQIWRLETDGQTNTLVHTIGTPIYNLQMSNVDKALYYQTEQQIVRLEPGSFTAAIIVDSSASDPLHQIGGFNLSPVNDELVYTQNNNLIRTDSLGQTHTVLVEGMPEPEYEAEIFGPSPWRNENEIYGIKWSPTGEYIAFGMGGVNVIARTGGDFQMLWPNDPVILDENNVVTQAASFIYPGAWSPDGSYLLLHKVFVAAHAEGYETAVAHLPDTTITPLPLSSPTHYDGLWADDSSTLYLYAGHNFFSGAPSALEQYQPKTDQLTPLITNPNWEDREPYSWVKAPFLDENGRLHFFLSHTPEFTFPTTAIPYELSHKFLTTNDLADLTAQSSQAVPFDYAVWSPTGSGVLLYIGNYETGDDLANPNTWLWLPLESEGQVTAVNLLNQQITNLVWDN